jgi:hypothetical protein
MYREPLYLAVPRRRHINIYCRSECAITLRLRNGKLATFYGLDGSWIKSWWGEASYTHPDCPEAHPASYTMGAGLFPGVKQPAHGINHPPHLAPRLKKE